MANVNTNYLPKLLAMGLKALRQNAVMPRLVNRSFEALAARPGNIINVPIPSAISARDVTAAITFASNVDYSPTNAAVTLDFWKEAPFQMSDSDFLSVEAGVIPMQASEAVKSLANAVDQYILAKTTGIYGYTGTAGTTPFNASLTAAVNARKILSKQLCPVDDRRVVINPDAEALLLLNTAVLQADQRGDQGGIVQGTIGQKLGMDWYTDQNVQTFAAGTGWASGCIASTLSGSVGDTTLNILNATASGAIKVGDIFWLTADTAIQTYAVTAAATISATVNMAITFTPALKTTVATGATLVVASGTYYRNLAFHRDAFAWASRPLQDVQGYGAQMMSVADPVSGVVLRLEVSRQYKQTTFSYDILGGGNLIRPELACIIAG